MNVPITKKHQVSQHGLMFVFSDYRLQSLRRYHETGYEIANHSRSKDQREYGGSHSYYGRIQIVVFSHASAQTAHYPVPA